MKGSYYWKCKVYVKGAKVKTYSGKMMHFDQSLATES